MAFSQDEDSLCNKLCTFTVTQKEFMNQHWYHCHTCKMNDGVGVCTVCAKVCHKDHDITYAKYGSFFCDCGAKEDGSCVVSAPQCSCLGCNQIRQMFFPLTLLVFCLCSFCLLQALVKRTPSSGVDGQNAVPPSPFATGEMDEGNDDIEGSSTGKGSSVTTGMSSSAAPAETGLGGATGAATSGSGLQESGALTSKSVKALSKQLEVGLFFMIYCENVVFSLKSIFPKNQKQSKFKLG